MASKMSVITILWFLSILVFASSVRNGVQRSVTVASQLRNLLDEETSLRQRLGNRVQRLRLEAVAINGTIVPCSCPSSVPKKSSSTPVAFVGTLPAAQTSLTSNTVFNFTNDLVNIGKPFNPLTAHFVAPISGLYAFSLAVYIVPGYWVKMQLVKDGTPILMTRNGHYSGRLYNVGTNYAIVNVTAGDEIWPQYVGGSARIYAEGVSTFTGVLLHEFEY